MPKTWNDEQLRAAVAESRNTSQVLRALGLRPVGGNYETIRRRISELGLDTRHWVRGQRVTSTESELRQAVAASTSRAGVITALGWPMTSGSRRRLSEMLLSYNIDISHFRRAHLATPRRSRLSIEELLTRPVTKTNWLKARLIEEGLLLALCDLCGRDEWMGRPIPLELDHINGNRDDNTLENLRLLCPNCHAMTPLIEAEMFACAVQWRHSPSGGMAYASRLNRLAREGMWVRLPPRALTEPRAAVFLCVSG
jgi:hypothetical protein